MGRRSPAFRGSRKFEPSEQQLRYVALMLQDPALKRPDLAKGLDIDERTIHHWWLQPDFRNWIEDHFMNTAQPLLLVAATRRVMEDIAKKGREGSQAARDIVKMFLQAELQNKGEGGKRPGVLNLLVNLGANAPAGVQLHPAAQVIEQQAAEAKEELEKEEDGQSTGS
ncbi:MAG: hypothetical protein DWQ01_08500 [Planctomycetota bacterium]|nr:MAG: hypothetical protein DWQ01_08500 [Planctomycetota bacterium]